MESLFSFPVGLLHPLQHAGLSRRTPDRRRFTKWPAHFKCERHKDLLATAPKRRCREQEIVFGTKPLTGKHYCTLSMMPIFSCRTWSLMKAT